MCKKESGEQRKKKVETKEKVTLYYRTCPLPRATHL